MGFLRRMSDRIWSFASPSKTNETPLTAPDTEPTFKKPLWPASHARARHVSGAGRSMSPAERVDKWRRATPSSEVPASIAGRKRQRLVAQAMPPAGRQHKMPRMDSEEMEYDGSASDADVLMSEEYDDESPLAFGRYNTPGIRPLSRSSSTGFGADDTMSIADSFITGENEVTPIRPKLVRLPTEHMTRGISTEELRSQGWDDDYITLIQKMALRGHEPLLPAYMQFEYKFLPDALFESTDEAFIASGRQNHFKASKALDQLFELGGRIRDRIYLSSRVEPESQLRRQLKSYLSWALDDAAIDRSTYIPILAFEAKPAGTEASILRTNATRRCRRLATRYRDALRVQRSVEISPASETSDSTLLSYPLPTFYAVVASHNIAAVMAYDPNAAEPECSPMAVFDFNEKDYDVWNSLALAILVCHVRNVHMRLAEETGLGLKQNRYKDGETKYDDPDK